MLGLGLEAYMQRYNLALLPLTLGPVALRLSKAFSQLSDSYLLGAASYPHVTLCQFYAEENEVGAIWEKANQAFSEKLLCLHFKQATTFEHIGKLWIQLIPKPEASLQKLHLLITEIVKLPLGLIRERYSPHLTLANIKKDQHEKALAQVAALRINFSDDFILALGSCDEMGQLTSILHGGLAKDLLPCGG